MTAKNANGPLKTFLRGGQVTLHTLRMFGQVIGFLAAAMAVFMGVIAYAGTMADTTWQERHYAMKLYEAGLYRIARAPLDTELNMRTGSGEVAPFTIETILTHEGVAAHEQAFRRTALFWSTVGAGSGGGLFLLLVALFLQRGGSLTRTNIKRGAAMTSASALKAAVTAHNRERRRKVEALRKRPVYSLAGVPYPAGSEVQHTAISGTIGSGKTQAIAALMEEIREAGDRAVVFDLTGGFIAPFYREGTDTILNPLDARSPNWSVFGEANSKAGFDAIASAMIPRGLHGDPVWADSARLVFSTAAQLLVGDGKPTNKDLVDTLLTADLDQLGTFFEGTPAAPIISPDSPKMTNSVRMMLNTYLDGLRLLPAEGQPFSITDWIENDEVGSTLFLSSRADMHETLKPLLTVWMDTAVRALMSRLRDPFRRVWFILDEVAALQFLPSIMDGLARGRQFGAAFVLGIQAQSQLRQIYGPDGAQSLSSVCRTKLILAAADADTANWYADFLGRQESSRSNENVSFGANTIRDGVMVARQEKIEHLVIPEEIMNLRSLKGFLKLPEGFPLAKVEVPLVIREDIASAFVPRPSDGLLVTRSTSAKSSKTPKTRRSDDGPDLFSQEDATNDDLTGLSAGSADGSGKDTDRGEQPLKGQPEFPGWDVEP